MSAESTLDEKTWGELREIAARYPEARSGLLPMLHLVQSALGQITPEGIEACAEILDISTAEVSGVATFYTMYNKRPVGDFLVQVCTNVACNLCGGDDVYEAFLEHMGVEAGETTPDGHFTVIEAECLGACGFPTAIQINDRYFENVTPDDVPAILTQLRGEAGAMKGAR